MKNLNLHKVFKTLIVFSLLLCVSFLAKTQEKVIYVKDFGAKGDGATNDTKAINAAIIKAAKENLKLFFEVNKIYIVDTVSLQGSKLNPYERLEVIGNNSTLKCINQDKNNVLNLSFVNTIVINNLKIIGNKSRKTNGNGIGVYYSKYCQISNCVIQDCKYSGILIAWVSDALIDGNLVFNNGDGSLTSDGITVHSLLKGTIRNNVVYRNNPLETQDGDGIQIGAIPYSIAGYYNSKMLGVVSVLKNICFQNGRRGIKIQRSNVVAKLNFLSQNAIGISIVNGLIPINNVEVKSNFVQKGYNGVTTEGGGKFNISKVEIEDNYFLGSLLRDKILLKDASAIKISKNSFDRNTVTVYNERKQPLRYQNINNSNAQNADSSQNTIIDMRSDSPLSSVVKVIDTKANSIGGMSVLNINSPETKYTIPTERANADNVFCVFVNSKITNARIDVVYMGQTKNYFLAKNKTLIVYSNGVMLTKFIY